MRNTYKAITALIISVLLTIVCFAEVTQCRNTLNSEPLYIAELTSGLSADPSGTLSLSQVITLASRLNSLYYSKDIVMSVSEPYLKYAVENGIVKDGEFVTLNSPATRIEAAAIMANALPEQFYTSINNIVYIPDVSKNAPEYSKIIMLYNSGILTGSNEYGVFRPYDAVKRSELARIIGRIVNPDDRVSQKLLTNTISNALVLVEDNEMLVHGWMKDTRGLSYNARLLSSNDAATLNSFTDVSTKYPSYKIRNFREQKSGVMTYVANFTLNASSNGFVVSINDRAGGDVLKTRTNDGAFYVGDKRVYEYPISRVTTLKAVIDLDNHVFDLYFNKTYAGRFPTGASAASRINIGFDEPGTGYVSLGGCNLNVNYYINEHFLGHNDAVDWRVSSDGIPDVGTVKLSDSNFSTEDVFSYRILNQAGKHTSVSKSFRPSSGNIGFEYKFLLPEAADCIVFRLGNLNDGFSIATHGTDLIAPDSSVIGTYAPNVWMTVRADINTESGKAFVRVNGKDKGEFNVSGDNYCYTDFSVIADTDVQTELLFDDVLVYPIMPEPSDYVPIPAPVASDDYYVGMNTCDLWRFGYWHGSTSSWMVVSAFDELTPYMGYYDDGNPEVSDWEIKWMSEHGIDYQLQCWYGPTTAGAPVKTPGFYNNLHEGYFNSKYKNYSKFAIMWENNFTSTIDSQGFRKYFVPYWIEYYFKDPNYFTIDNKPVFSIYNYSKLINYFGSVSNVWNELDYLRCEVKKLGFDDIIILFAGAGGSAQDYNNMMNSGGNGVYNYNLGKSSSSAAYQKSIMEENARKSAGVDGIYYIPTISMGFNNVARGDTRSENITISDYSEICNWTKNTLLKNSEYYNQSSPLSRMVLLSCWNEYDEGHYLNPSNLHGFEYLDVLRDTFGSGNIPAHTDTKPTENQVSRMQVLFPDNYSMLRPLRWYGYNSAASFISDMALNDRLEMWDFTKDGMYASSGWTLINATAINTTGKLEYTAKTSDPILQISGLKLDLTDCDYLHVRIKGVPANGMASTTLQVFFTTSASTSWASNKCISTNYDTGKTVDLYVKMSSNSYWNGTLTGLRLDILSTLGTMETELVELVKNSVNEVTSSVFIDKRECDFEFPIVIAENFIVPFVPNTGIFGMLNSSYKWSRFSGVLEMTVGQTEITFTVGSSVAVVDGNPCTLANEVYLVDGIPMLPIDKICEFAGYSCIYDDDNSRLDIETTDGEEARLVNGYEANRVPYTYMFGIDGYAEGWKISNSCVSVMSVADGSLYIKSNGIDPNISLGGLSIDTEKYKKCNIRMKSVLASNDSLSMYFAQSGVSLSEQRRVSVGITASNKDYVEYVVDMSANENWTGIVTQLRFDPFSCPGECYIDYIMFSE